MSFLSFNSTDYTRKTRMGEHKVVKPVDDQAEHRSEDSGVQDHVQDRKKKNKLKKEPEKKKEEDTNIQLRETTYLIGGNDVKNIIYIDLIYPEKKELKVDYETGDILTNILMIPKIFWRIIGFDPKTFPKNKNRALLYEIGYWRANDKGVQYLGKGKTVSLLKKS